MKKDLRKDLLEGLNRLAGMASDKQTARNLAHHLFQSIKDFAHSSVEVSLPSPDQSKVEQQRQHIAGLKRTIAKLRGEHDDQQKEIAVLKRRDAKANERIRNSFFKGMTPDNQLMRYSIPKIDPEALSNAAFSLMTEHTLPLPLIDEFIGRLAELLGGAVNLEVRSGSQQTTIVHEAE